MEDEQTYSVSIFYFRDEHDRHYTDRGLTKEEAMEICSSAEASSETCTSEYLKKRTEEKGPWFLGFDRE